MQTLKTFVTGLDKTVVKQFVTVTGVILFFILGIAIIPLVSFGQQEAAINALIAMTVVAGITGFVGREYFMAV
jgi:hypothetical protein